MRNVTANVNVTSFTLPRKRKAGYVYIYAFSVESFLSLGACIVIVMASGSGGQNGGILCIMARPFVRRVVRMTYRDGRGLISRIGGTTASRESNNC